jgi:hypothetical protein
LFSTADRYYRLEPVETNRMIRVLPEPLKNYLVKHEFEKVIEEINQNSGGKDTFLKRFYQWWNAFRILKYMNFVHAGYYTKLDATVAAEFFLKRLIPSYTSSENSKLVLESLRKLERQVTI